MLKEYFKLKVDNLRVTSPSGCHYTAVEMHIELKFCLIYFTALADFKTRKRH